MYTYDTDNIEVRMRAGWTLRIRSYLPVCGGRGGWSGSVVPEGGRDGPPAGVVSLCVVVERAVVVDANRVHASSIDGDGTIITATNQAVNDL